MATASTVSLVASVGEVAGTVWRVLSDNGPMTLAKLVKSVGEPRDTVMQAIGWLARENKIELAEEGHSRVVSLR